MSTIQAIYENGVFRPTSPVDLPEQTAVEVVVPEALPVAKPSIEAGIGRGAGAWAAFPEMDAVMEQIQQERATAIRPEVAF